MTHPNHITDIQADIKAAIRYWQECLSDMEIHADLPDWQAAGNIERLQGNVYFDNWRYIEPLFGEVIDLAEQLSIPDETIDYGEIRDRESAWQRVVMLVTQLHDKYNVERALPQAILHKCGNDGLITPEDAAASPDRDHQVELFFNFCRERMRWKGWYCSKCDDSQDAQDVLSAIAKCARYQSLMNSSLIAYVVGIAQTAVDAEYYLEGDLRRIDSFTRLYGERAISGFYYRIPFDVYYLDGRGHVTHGATSIITIGPNKELYTRGVLTEMWLMLGHAAKAVGACQNETAYAYVLQAELAAYPSSKTKIYSVGEPQPYLLRFGYEDYHLWRHSPKAFCEAHDSAGVDGGTPSTEEYALAQRLYSQLTTAKRQLMLKRLRVEEKECGTFAEVDKEDFYRVYQDLM